MSKEVTCPNCKSYPLVMKEGARGPYYACDGFRQTRGRQKCPFVNQRDYEALESGGTIQQKATSSGKLWFSGTYYPKAMFDKFQPKIIRRADNATDEQRRIFDAIKELYKHAHDEEMRLLLVEALAGSGKTFSLVQASAHLPSDAECIAIVYNKRNAVEMAERFPGNTFVSTINALGHMIIQMWLGRCRDMNPDKNMHMIAAEWGEENLKDEEYFFAAVRASDLISKCKLTLVTAEDATDDKLLEIAEYYSVDMDGINFNLCFDMVRHVLKSFWTKEALLRFGIDYDDQVAVPVIHKDKLRFPRFHIAYVDEAQDVNNARRALALLIANVIVVVGDRHQAIYGFAGANTASLDAFKEDVPNHQVLPLSINWRCGRHIIEVAQCIVPEIKAGLTHDGDLYTLTEERAPEVMQPGDMGLCRTNAPLISLAYGFIKANVPVCILGRDIGKNLRDLVLKLSRKGRGKLAKEFVSVGELLTRLEEYFQIEAEKLPDNTRGQQKLQQLVDKVESIKALCEGMRSVGTGTDADDEFTVLGRIAMLFTDDSKRGQIVLCTVHKSKGLEARRVFIFKPELMPFPYAKSEWQIEQEYNLLYVAITRAMEALFVCGPLPEKLAPVAHLFKQYTDGSVIESDDESEVE